MSNESTLWAYLRDGLKDNSIHLSRVESHSTSIGIPDVNFTIDGKDGWIELKFENSKGIYLRESQYCWMRDRLRVGCNNIHVLWGADVEYMDERGKCRVYGLVHVHCITQLKQLRGMTKPVEWASESLAQWNNNIDFKQLKGLLK